MNRMATLDSLKKKEKEEDTGSEGEGQEYYAGGHGGQRGGSGLAVVGPPPDRRSEESPIQDIFNRASGAEPGEDDTSKINHTIYMYRSGYTINDGPFRRLDDPANRPFLEDLGRGIVPRELVESVGQNQSLSVKLEDRRTQEYIAPAYVAFGGEGRTMGSSSALASDSIVGVTDIGKLPEVDESKPLTTLQVRLHDGRRIRARLNLTHTLRDVQAIIQSNNAGQAPYVLMGGYPPVALSNLTQSLEEAGLNGAQIIQKLC